MQEIRQLLDMVKDKNLLSYLFVILLTAAVTFFVTDIYFKKDEVKEWELKYDKLEKKYNEKENISIELSEQKNETKNKSEELKRKDDEIINLKREISKVEESKKKLGEELVKSESLIAEKSRSIHEKELIIQRITSCQNDPALIKLITERDKLLENKGVYVARSYSNSGAWKQEEQKDEERRISMIKNFNDQINDIRRVSQCIN